MANALVAERDALGVEALPLPTWVNQPLTLKSFKLYPVYGAVETDYGYQYKEIKKWESFRQDATDDARSEQRYHPRSRPSNDFASLEISKLVTYGNVIDLHYFAWWFTSI